MSSSHIVELAATKLESVDICRAIKVERIHWVNIYTLPVKTRLEALYTDNSEQKPEEADEERDVDKEWCCFFQASKNDLNMFVSSVEEKSRLSLLPCHL